MLVYLGVWLRDCVSLFNRFDITLDQIGQLSVACHENFSVSALLIQSLVNPSVWKLGHIVPAHCSQVFEKYGPHLNTFLLESSVKTQATKLDGQRYLGMNSQCLPGYLCKVSCSQELSAKIKSIYHQEFLMIDLTVTVDF